MKVIIVEPGKQESRKVIRMLQAIDDSIQLTGVLRGIDELLKWDDTKPVPDLVLINRSLISHVQQTVEAKLIIPGRISPLVYLAYRVNNLKYLEKKLLQKKSLIQHKEEGCDKPVTPLLTGHKTPFHPPVRKRFLVTHQQKYLSVPVEDISYFFQTTGLFSSLRSPIKNFSWNTVSRNWKTSSIRRNFSVSTVLI